MKRIVHFQNVALVALAASALYASLGESAVDAAEPPRLQAGSPSPLAWDALTLERAISLALAHNPEVPASEARVEAAAGRAYQARRWTNPELELASEDVPVRSGSFRESKNTVGVAQTVPWPGKKKLDGQIGVAGVRLSEANMSQRRLELVRDVKISFYRVLASEGLVSVASDLAAVAEASANTARKRVEAGAAGDQEQLRAEIQLEQARIELSAFQRELVTARQDLVTFLGRPELRDAPVSGALADAPDAMWLDREPAQWLIDHPSMVAARTVRDRTELELRRARLEAYPDVRLGVDGGREGREDNAIVQFRVSVPLPIIDRSKGRRREAQANLREAEAELVATEQRLLREWNTATKQFRTAAEQVAAYRERILPKANSALRLVQTGFEEGKFGLIDLLDTQRTTAEARLAYQQKLLELNAAHAALEALPGATLVSNQARFSPQPK